MKDEKEWLVSDKTCKGCKYYGYLSVSGRVKACLYSVYEKGVRTEKPKDCKHKKMGRMVYEDELRKTRKRPKKGTV